MCWFLDEFPDPAYGAFSTRNILRNFEKGQIMHDEPTSMFIDNLRFYDFVLHTEDVRKIFSEGENLKSISHICS